MLVLYLMLHPALHDPVTKHPSSMSMYSYFGFAPYSFEFQNLVNDLVVDMVPFTLPSHEHSAVIDTATASDEKVQVPSVEMTTMSAFADVSTAFSTTLH